MLFNSIEYLFFFIILSITYYIFPKKYQRTILVLFSIYFYMYALPYFVIIVFLTIINDYIAGKKIEKNKNKKFYYLLQSVILNIGILIFFKYSIASFINLERLAHLIGWNYDLNILKTIIPVGISFYIFKSLSYVIEVYRGNIKAEYNLLNYTLFVLFFPEVLAGPIDRPNNLLPQIKSFHYFNYDKTTEGLKLIAWGLFKKVVIADRLAIFVNHAHLNIESYSGLPLIMIVIFYSIQIYCDFSGYSDIAIGTGKFLGFDLMINFNKPYFSQSISEFWRRWHISLSLWFRDYIFLPIAFITARITNKFNLKSSFRDSINYSIATLVTMILIGLWHGINITFIIWGLLIGLYLTLSVITKKSRKRSLNFLKKYLSKKMIVIIRTMFIFCLITITWIFFRADNLSQASSIINNLFLNSKGGYIFGTSQFQVLLGILFTIILFYVEFKTEGYNPFIKIKKRSNIYRWGLYYLLIISILLFGEFGNNNFIYFQF